VCTFFFLFFLLSVCILISYAELHSPQKLQHLSVAVKMAQRLDMDEPLESALQHKKRFTYQNPAMPFYPTPTDVESISRRRTWKTL
jgi:hypothetical protein